MKQPRLLSVVYQPVMIRFAKLLSGMWFPGVDPAGNFGRLVISSSCKAVINERLGEHHDVHP